jgi:L-lysine exporter family protein LysE/ArgO
MLSVIVAIGPQNAFLLRQAVRHDHAWLVAGIFLSGDVAMTLLGGFGIGQYLEQWALLKMLLTVFGALYVFWFGVGICRKMIRPQALAPTPSTASGAIIPRALAVTFLNPHAIFDTVVLVGTIALQFQGMDKKVFIAGAVAGSASWFFGIAWAGQRLAPFLSRPQVWRVIDGVIVAVMMVMATTLAVEALRQGQALAGGSSDPI